MKEGGKGRGKKGERGERGEGVYRGERRGREEGGGERREGKIAKGQWQKQHLTVQLFDAPMIKASFVFRSPD